MVERIKEYKPYLVILAIGFLVGLSYWAGTKNGVTQCEKDAETRIIYQQRLRFDIESAATRNSCDVNSDDFFNCLHN